jgi:hypothetical protein
VRQWTRLRTSPGWGSLDGNTSVFS